jgi:hypothetical protein
MNTGSGQNLNWFFQNWFFSNNYLDLKIDGISKGKAGQTPVRILNVGGFAIPFDVVITYQDGKTERKHFTPAVWKTNQKVTSINLNTKNAVKSIAIDNGIYVDATPKDNIWNVK